MFHFTSMASCWFPEFLDFIKDGSENSRYPITSHKMVDPSSFECPGWAECGKFLMGVAKLEPRHFSGWWADKTNRCEIRRKSSQAPLIHGSCSYIPKKIQNIGSNFRIPKLESHERCWKCVQAITAIQLRKSYSSHDRRAWRQNLKSGSERSQSPAAVCGFSRFQSLQFTTPNYGWWSSSLFVTCWFLDQNPRIKKLSLHGSEPEPQQSRVRPSSG